MSDILLKRAEVAKRLGISERTIKRMETCGQLPKVTLSPRIVRYRQSDIDAIVCSNGHSDFSRYGKFWQGAPDDRSRQLVVSKWPDLARSVPRAKNFHK